MPQVSTQYRPPQHEQLDRRTWQAKLLAQVRRELAEDVGGAPTATQRALIDRAAWLTVHLAQLDRRVGEGLATDTGEYAQMSAALATTLAQLGRQDAAPLPGLVPRYSAAPMPLAVPA